MAKGKFSHDEAMAIAREAQAMFALYQGGSVGVDYLLLKRGFEKGLPWSVGAGAAVMAKGGAEEEYEDDIHDYIIQSAINNYNLAKNPPEGTILPP